jgi:RNA polymerase sigma-70 factor (ECF subfamily)
VPQPEKLARFERLVLPHLDAAYNLARWLTGDGHDAEDVVQEAYLRAYRAFDQFRGDDGRAWLLTVVRNTGYSWLKRNRAHEPAVSFDEAVHDVGSDAGDPERLALQGAAAELLRRALDQLPVEYREVIVLRELEGLSYKEIAAVAAIPLGTVMSRLARARERLQQALAPYHRTGEV